MKKATRSEEQGSLSQGHSSTRTTSQQQRTLEVKIQTILETAVDLECRTHRGVARYVLIALAGGGQ